MLTPIPEKDVKQAIVDFLAKQAVYVAPDAVNLEIRVQWPTLDEPSYVPQVTVELPGNGA